MSKEDDKEKDEKPKRSGKQLMAWGALLLVVVVLLWNGWPKSSTLGDNATTATPVAPAQDPTLSREGSVIATPEPTIPPVTTSPSIEPAPAQTVVTGGQARTARAVSAVGVGIGVAPVVPNPPQVQWLPVRVELCQDNRPGFDACKLVPAQSAGYWYCVADADLPGYARIDYMKAGSSRYNRLTKEGGFTCGGVRGP